MLMVDRMALLKAMDKVAAQSLWWGEREGVITMGGGSGGGGVKGTEAEQEGVYLGER